MYSSKWKTRNILVFHFHFLYFLAPFLSLGYFLSPKCIELAAPLVDLLARLADLGAPLLGLEAPLVGLDKIYDLIKC